ncbi:MAG: hypothetical protein WCO84_01065 [bacterium]
MGLGLTKEEIIAIKKDVEEKNKCKSCSEFDTCNIFEVTIKAFEDFVWTKKERN